jgi:hypothetical protein
MVQTWEVIEVVCYICMYARKSGATCIPSQQKFTFRSQQSFLSQERKRRLVWAYKVQVLKHCGHQYQYSNCTRRHSVKMLPNCRILLARLLSILTLLFFISATLGGAAHQVPRSPTSCYGHRKCPLAFLVLLSKHLPFILTVSWIVHEYDVTLSHLHRRPSRLLTVAR